MKTWRVYVHECDYAYVEVDADSAELAEKQVLAKVADGDITWDHEDAEITDVIEIDPETRKDIRHL